MNYSIVNELDDKICEMCKKSLYEKEPYPFVLVKNTGQISQYFPRDYYSDADNKMFFCTRKCVESYKLNPYHLVENLGIIPEDQSE